MGPNALRLACIILLASLFPAASRHDSFRQEMRFGAEAAQRGLWREAVFRWEKIVKSDPHNARLHNNLAVAYESLGQFERARQEYEEARRLDPGNKEIRDNYQSFLEFCRTTKVCGGEPEAAPAPAPEPAASPAPSATPDGGSPAPNATPRPAAGAEPGAR